MPTRTLSVRSRRGGIAVLATVVALVASVIVPQAATAAGLPSPDGLSAATAAASCYEIKQLTPSAPSGVYWLVTPTLGAPAQFYCDQTTSGGGWVLIGRGREGWSDETTGVGTTAQVSSTITGTAAFSPKELSAKVIGGLLNGGAVTSLPDGIRLHRATNIAGTTWQDVTFSITSPRPDWSWAFDNQQRVGNWNVGGVTGSGGSTQSFGSGNGTNQVLTESAATEGWEAGFGFGSSTHGSTDASSYLWTQSSTAGYARPFTQVFLRPQLTSSIFTTIPDTGTTKVEQSPVAESAALPTNWGVSGIGAGPNSVEGSNEVSAFAEGNGIVYVGGNFLTVQKSAAGASQVNQSYLAAFDVHTGEFISSFRPTFDKQVKALAVLPNGDLAVGGFFGTVDGASHPALAILNPTTGAVDPAYSTQLIDALSGGVPFVRALDVQGGWLYLGGEFTHITGGTATSPVYSRAAGRISVTDGTPDASWNPEFNGTVISLDASSQGDRVYFAGFFDKSKTSTAVKGAAISTTGATDIPWNITFSASANYQQAVKEVGNKVYIAGSEHMLFGYNRSDMSPASTTILGSSGGDGQAIATDGTTIYAGCHCFWTEYDGASQWPNIGTAWTSANKINSFGAWNAATGKYEAQFNPTVSQRHGAGSWALFVDSTGVLWTGGDYTSSFKAGSTNQWSGGFVRFAPNDSTAPTTPTALSVTTNGTNDSLSWTGSTDAGGAVTYQILRNDRVVATSTTTTATLPAAPTGTKYFVRAADPSGNWSASTPDATVAVTPPGDNPNYIPAGSSWSYYYNATDPAAGWQAPGYDASSWAVGAAPIGFGQPVLGTTLTAPAPKPITAYYRKTFTVTDATKVASVQLTTRADDGIIVYVNGTEVLRKNIDPGAVTSATDANVAVSAANAVANPITVTVPGSAFVTGANVITAEVHSNYHTTPSASFELTAMATFGTQPGGTPPPANPPANPPADGSVPAGTALVATGSNWSYLYNATAPDATWNSNAFDSSSWPVGAAPLGWGQAVLGTTLSTDASKLVTTYYRKSFTVADPTKIAGGIDITTRADDGIILYLNGVEISRVNMDPGAVTSTTDANAAVSAANALANPVKIHIPSSALLAGTNVISAEVHSNYKSTPSASFEFSAIVS
jgi:hypothetical protein